MQMAIKLRKKAPFTCRYIDLTTGKLAHADHPLSDTDGDMCPAHAKATKDAHDRFWNTPIKPKIEEKDDWKPRGRVWP